MAFVDNPGRTVIDYVAPNQSIPATNKAVAMRGMNARVRALNRYLSYYVCDQYGNRSIAWDGYKYVDDMDLELITREGYIPDGFESHGADTPIDKLPLKYRRPSSPYHLARLIVRRFSAKLFGESSHPEITVPDDQDTEAFVQALIGSSQFWSKMLMARNLGGAMGSVAIGFVFFNGKPVIEVHDSRWVSPKFTSPFSHEVESCEIRYIRPVETWDDEAMMYRTVEYWYRREITQTQDITYPAVRVSDVEPNWDSLRSKSRVIDHGYGFCPIVWVQNIADINDIDGAPDCLGAFDMLHEIDMILSQCTYGAVRNIDPTLVVNTEKKFKDIKKGSDNAIRLNPGDTVDILELQGSSINAGLEVVRSLRGMVLEVTQCALDDPHGSSKTATEVNALRESQRDRVEELRGQWGELGVKCLIEMMLAASEQIIGRHEFSETHVVRLKLQLPMRPDGREQVLGPRRSVSLRWPNMVTPNVDDTGKAVNAAVNALSGSVTDISTAIRYVTPYLHGDDPQKIMQALLEAKEQEQQAMQGPPEAAPGAQAPTQEREHFYQYELESGLLTVNEWRKSRDLPLLQTDDGNLTVPQLRAKYAQTFALDALVQSPDGAEKILTSQIAQPASEPEPEPEPDISYESPELE